MERPLPAFDALSDEAADQTSGRNLPVFKTGSVYCVSCVPHETIVFVFPLAPVEPKFDLNVIFVYSWATFYLLYFISNIIREIFVEDHVQQVSTSIKETLRDLTLLCHARDFKFCMSQAQWCVKIFVFFKKCFVLLYASCFFVFPRQQSI